MAGFHLRGSLLSYSLGRGKEKIRKFYSNGEIRVNLKLAKFSDNEHSLFSTKSKTVISCSKSDKISTRELHIIKLQQIKFSKCT